MIELGSALFHVLIYTIVEFYKIRSKGMLKYWSKTSYVECWLVREMILFLMLSRYVHLDYERG